MFTNATHLRISIHDVVLTLKELQNYTLHIIRAWSLFFQYSFMYGFFFYQKSLGNCNPGQNIWNRVEKSSKIGQDSKREKCLYSELFWSECGKMRSRISPNTDTFYAVTRKVWYLLLRAFWLLLPKFNFWSGRSWRAGVCPS